MAHFTLRQLSYFVAVADAGSLAGAAERLHVSHTAVAAALTELERLLRSQLAVRRKAHGVTLTPAGRHLYARAQALLEDAEEIELSVVSQGAELAGPLVVGCYSTLAPTVTPPLWAAFAHQHSKVKLSFVTGTQDEISASLDRGELDLAVVYDSSLPASVGSVTLYAAAPHILMPPDHPLASSTGVTLRDLAGEALVLLETPPSGQHNLTLFREAGVEPNIVHRTSDFELTRSLVARGVGCAILHQRPSVDVSYEGLPLLVRPIRPQARPIRVLMVWSQGVRLNDRMRAMIVAAPGACGHLGRSAVGGNMQDRTEN